jgi:hypothetical protein
MVALIIISPIVGSIFLIGKITTFISESYNKLKPKKVKPSETYEETLARWDRERAAEDKRYLFWNKVGNISSKFFKWVILPLLGITILYLLSSSAYQMGWLGTLITILVFSGILGIMLSIYWLLDRYGEVVGGGFVRLVVTIFKFINPFNWKVTMIIGEMIKAGYTKACPLIQWDENLEESKNNL